MALPKSVSLAIIGLSCFIVATAAEGPTKTDDSNAVGNQPSPVDPSQQVGPEASGVSVGPYPYPYMPQAGPYAGSYMPQPGPYGPYMPQSEFYTGYPYPYGPGPYVVVSETKTIDKDGHPTKQNVISSTHYASALNGQFLNNLDLEIGK